MPLTDYGSALVTGASSGIGAATVHALASRGLIVHAAARRRDRLDRLAAETGCVVHVVDVRDTKLIYERFSELEIDIIVNNAGSGRGFEALFSAEPDEIDETINTNLVGAVHLLRAVCAGMVTRQRGHIVNVGSIGGLYPLSSSIYGATKGAIHLLSQNLRIELKGTGVRVTEICPGRVKTEFVNAAFKDPAARQAFVSGFEIMMPDDIADAILYALDTPWHVNVSLIELVCTEQYIGTSAIAPVARP